MKIGSEIPKVSGIEILDGKVGYSDIPKVACTSIKLKLYQLDNNLPFDRQVVGKDVHKYFGQSKIDISNCDHRFLVVRDPIKRFLSAYSNRVGHHKELSRDYLNTPAVENLLPRFFSKRIINNPGLGQFIEFIDLYRKVPTVDWHVKSICSFAPDLSAYTDVYPLEDISSFQNKLSEITNKEVLFERSQSEGRKISIKELSSSQFEFLADYYSEDYKLLGVYYSIDSLWKEWKKP
jgi:hypothetical protein